MGGDRRLKVYISGPLTSSGKPEYNVLRASDVARELIAMGFAPLCPHLTWYLDPDAKIPHATWMEVDHPWVEAADVVLRLPGESKGADYECAAAADAGIPVVRSLEELDETASILRQCEGIIRPESAERNEAAFQRILKEHGVAPHSGIERVSARDTTQSDGLHKFASGAVRSTDADAYRYDLISPIGLRRVAETCAEGAAKYGDFNWERGMPVHDLLNHALRHLHLYLAGDRTEDHLGHAAWNVMGACHSEELWPELNVGRLRQPGCRPPEAKP